MCKKRMRAFLHICLSFAKVVNIIYKCKEDDNILLNNVYFLFEIRVYAICLCDNVGIQIVFCSIINVRGMYLFMMLAAEFFVLNTLNYNVTWYYVT